MMDQFKKIFSQAWGADWPSRRDEDHRFLNPMRVDYRTNRVILEIYDEMTEAMRTGKLYQTRLDPPPADPRCCHPPRGGKS